MADRECDPTTGRPRWCGTCGDGVRHQPPPPATPDRWPERPCRVCAQPSAPAHFFCAPNQVAAEDMLRAALPVLQTWMEARAGAELDTFLAAGVVPSLQWWVGDIAPLATNLAEAIWEAYSEESLDVRCLGPHQYSFGTPENPHPYWGLWDADDEGWVVPSLTTALTAALPAILQALPTAPVGRQLLRAWRNDLRGLLGADLQEGADEMMQTVPQTVLSADAKALADLRYADTTFWWHGWDEPDPRFRAVLGQLPTQWHASLTRMWDAMDAQRLAWVRAEAEETPDGPDC